MRASLVFCLVVIAASADDSIPLKSLGAQLSSFCEAAFPSFLSSELVGNLTNMCSQGDVFISQVALVQGQALPLIKMMGAQGLLAANASCSDGIHLYAQFQSEPDKAKQQLLQSEWDTERGAALQSFSQANSSCWAFSSSVFSLSQPYLTAMMLSRDNAAIVCSSSVRQYDSALSVMEYWMNQTAADCPTSPLCASDKSELHNVSLQVQALAPACAYCNASLPVFSHLLSLSMALLQQLSFWRNGVVSVCSDLDAVASNVAQAVSLNNTGTDLYLVATLRLLDSFGMAMETLAAQSCLISAPPDQCKSQSKNKQKTLTSKG